jgi:hypothetical protein
MISSFTLQTWSLFRSRIFGINELRGLAKRLRLHTQQFVDSSRDFIR